MSNKADLIILTCVMMWIGFKDCQKLHCVAAQKTTLHI